MSDSSFPLVSVVSLSYNRKRDVLNLLAALQKQDYEHFEVILVDNHSEDGTPEAVGKLFPEVKILRCSQNYGMVSYNFGFSIAKGKYILVIDDDGLPGSPHWITDIVERFEANPRLGVVACTIRMRDSGYIAYDSPQFIPEGNDQTGFPAAAFNGTGAGLRADAIHKVGYYPFHFYRSWLEFHLTTRIRDAGWEVCYFPKIEVWHNRSSGTVNRPFTFYGLRNYLWYVWELYPWPEVLIETFHYLGSRLKSVFLGKLSVELFIKSFLLGFIGGLQCDWTRKPISKKTLKRLQRIRKFGNDYGVVVQHRSFVSLSNGANVPESILNS